MTGFIVSVAARLSGVTPVEAWLAYDVDDPYAVTLTVIEGSGRTVVWWLSRDLMFEGLEGDTGTGDVRIHPGPFTPDALVVHLTTPTGYAAIELDRDTVTAVLDRSEDLVARGSERVDWVREWALLAGEDA